MADWLWTAEDAARAAMGRATGGWRGVSGVSIDTREITPGDLFVALKGDARDGHAFVADALAKGAAAALVARRPEGLADDAPLLIVADDTLRALERMAEWARARAENLSAIAVTGSVGKTSTKDMIAHALRVQRAARGLTHAAAKSFNNHWGAPLTLARMPADARFGVFELGMNHPGEIRPLSKLVRPDVAVITAVEPVHLEAFHSVDGIADAKAEIFEGAPEGAVAVLNQDNPYFGRLHDHAIRCGVREILTFGETGRHARLLEARLTNVGGRTRASSDVVEGVTTVRAALLDQEVMFQIGAAGRHFAINALAGLLAVHAAGGDIGQAALSLRTWRPIEGRGTRARIALPQGGDFLLIDESYNANPASMRAAIAAVASIPTDVAPSGADGLRMAFFTDMLELGPRGPSLHAELARAPGVAAFDTIHTTGPLMRALHEALPPAVRGLHADTIDALVDIARRSVRPGDVVMVKGSKGSRASSVAAALGALGEPELRGDEANDDMGSRLARVANEGT